MKYAILLGDGMADEPVHALGGKTPLEHASTPHMDALATRGRLGRAKTVPDGMPPGSDVANMSVLGYDPGTYYTGRAPIEAAGMGVHLAEGATAFRCNLVHLADGKMADYSAGAIESSDSHPLIEEIAREIASDTVHLHAGVSYRHLLLIDDFPRGELSCTPPHDISDQDYAPFLPSGAGRDLLVDLMERARGVCEKSEVNARRRVRGKVTATDIWLWGHGRAVTLPSVPERFGVRGSVISAVDLVRGLGRLAGLNVRTVEGATGYLDTNYAGKVAAARAALEDEDLVYLHVEAPDETSHEGSLDKKIQAIEDFDEKIVGEIIRLEDRHEDLRILVLPDHPTLLATKTHDRSPVPFLVAGAGIEPDGSRSYSEEAARGAPLLTGATLFEEFLRGDFS